MTGTAVENLAERIGTLSVGKRIGGAVYVHRDTVAQEGRELVDAVCSCAAEAGVAVPWNVCKFSWSRGKMSLLHYPRFREHGHPALAVAATVDLNGGAPRIRRYAPHGNPPILHRKELLLDVSDPDYAKFAALTEEEQRAGLFVSATTIGHERGWTKELERRGLVIRGHRLLRKGQ